MAVAKLRSRLAVEGWFPVSENDSGWIERGRAAAQSLSDRLGGRLLGALTPLLGLLLLLWLARVVPFAAALLLALTAIGTVAAIARMGHPRPAGLAVQRERDARDGWRLVVAAIPDPAIALDDTGHVLHINGPASDLFPGLRPGPALTRTLRYPELTAAVDSATDVLQPAAVEIVERIPVERRLTAVVTRLHPRHLDERGAPSLLITFRDLSEQERLARMREDFVANASHELRTPLASLKGFLETLQGPARNDPAAQERFLGLMTSQADRMSRLIDDLLSLSRVEMRAHVPPRGIVDLNELARYALDTLAPLAAQAGTELKLVTSGQAARVRGDRDELLQVMTNLVQNAIVHAGRGKGPIEVSVTRQSSEGKRPGRASIAVRDHGPGIAAEHLPRLTERFYRVSAAASRARGGTGLGLAIVKHIVARHRGDLSIESRLGEGSTFTVAFDEIATP